MRSVLSSSRCLHFCDKLFQIMLQRQRIIDRLMLRESKAMPEWTAIRTQWHLDSGVGYGFLEVGDVYGAKLSWLANVFSLPPKLAQELSVFFNIMQILVDFFANVRQKNISSTDLRYILATNLIIMWTTKTAIPPNFKVSPQFWVSQSRLPTCWQDSEWILAEFFYPVSLKI